MLSFNVSGDENAKPMIFLHGMFGKKNNFNSLMKHFSNGFRVYAVDMLSHGSSPRSKSLLYKDFAQSIKSFMEEIGIEKAVIIGHSMGGKTAMRFAFDNPKMVEKVIILDVAPVFYQARAWEYTHRVCDFLLTMPLDEISSRKQALSFIDTSIYPIPKNDALFMVQSLKQDEESGKFFWEFDLQTLRKYCSYINQSPLGFDDIYTGDALFLRGESSDFLLDKDLPAVKKHFPNSKVVDIPNSGHNVHIDNPQEVINEIEKFLA